MDRISKSLFIITDNEEQLDKVCEEIEETLQRNFGVEYGWNDDQPIN